LLFTEKIIINQITTQEKLHFEFTLKPTYYTVVFKIKF